MTRNARYYLKVGITILFGCAIIAYAFYQSRSLREGPIITITSPQDGETATSSPIFVQGNAQNISSITLDDRVITTDEQGNFSEKVFPLQGENVIKVEAVDRFKRKITKLLQVVYTRGQDELFQTFDTSTTTATTSEKVL